MCAMMPGWSSHVCDDALTTGQQSMEHKLSFTSECTSVCMPDEASDGQNIALNCKGRDFAGMFIRQRKSLSCQLRMLNNLHDNALEKLERAPTETVLNLRF